MARKPVKINPIRGKRLKLLIEEQGITQSELKDRIFISQQTISKIINGKANLTETTARIIADAFPGSEYTFEKLMGYDLEPKLYDNPLEFQKDWIRSGGGAHPLTNMITVEARISVALEKMNQKGWQLAVSLIETLGKMPDLQKGKGEE